MPHLSTPIDAQPRSRILGGAGTRITWHQISDLDENTEVRGNKWYGTASTLGLAGKMLRDAHVRKSVDAIIDPIIGAAWDFEPGGKSALDIEVADYCRYNFFERNRWSDILRQHLSYVAYGFSLLEITDEPVTIPTSRFRAHPGGGTGIVISGMHHRPAWTVDGWIQSTRDPSKLFAVSQWVQGSDAEQARFATIFADRLVRATWGQEGANFAGLAPLRGAYGPWKIKRLMMVIEAIFHERTHAGLPTIKQTVQEAGSEEEIQDAQTILAEVRANEKGFLYLPYGFEFEWNTVQNTTNIGETIERANRDIAYNLGVAWMLLGSIGTSGSFALASTQRGQYEIQEDNHARFVEDNFNTTPDGWSPIERLVRLNYGSDAAIPRLVARNMPTTDWSKILPITHNLTISGHITPDERTESFMRAIMKMPQRDQASERARPNQPQSNDAGIDDQMMRDDDASEMDSDDEA